MSEAADWKQKYHDSLRELESEEKRWRQLEQALRRVVGRLCAAGMGVDPRLDDELSTLAAANRRNADAAELVKLADSLTTAVVAVDAVSPVPTIVFPAPPPVAKRWDSACAAAAKVLLSLRAPDEAAAARELSVRLAKAATDAELAIILEKIAELIQSRGDAIARERLQAAAVLADVTSRLEEMAGYLAASGEEARTRFTDSATVNDTVMSQVRELSLEVHTATELNVLQSLVSARLETVTRQVLDFRSREEKRRLEQTSRAERMHDRILDMEREMQDLKSRLDQEKYGARQDSLTLVANRKSFDERFALTMAESAHSGVPVAVLLWDLDNFKIVNDTYGHRAGDRVLKTVANCLVSGLRPEDFVARIGGEEFVVLLTGVTFPKAQQIADELRLGVQGLRFHFRGMPIRVTISCGLTEFRPGDSGNAAFDRADAALYRAKTGGRNLCIAA